MSYEGGSYDVVVIGAGHAIARLLWRLHAWAAIR